MAATKYTYSVAGDFPATGVNPGGFSVDIAESAIVIALDRIDVEGDVCDIWFKDALSAGDKTILDGDTTAPAGGLIAAHTGQPVDAPTVITTPTTAADGTPIVTDRSLTLGQSSFLRTDNGTELLAVDGRAAGAATNIWDGTGAGDTGTGDWTPSGTGSETPGSMHAGTNGWDTGSAAKDSNTLWTNGSDIDVSGYSQLSFWMQPKAFPSGARVDIRWQTVAGSDRGVLLDLAGYVSNYDLNVWQKITIPMADFSIGANNVGRLRIIYAKAAGQQFWFDEFAFTAAGGGGPYIFQTAAPATVKHHVSMMVIVVSGPGSGWNPTSFGNLSGLTNGLLLRQRRISTGEVLWSLNSKDNVDLFGRFHPQDDITFSDGTLLVGFMVKPGKASVVVTADDVLEVVVRDDLSALSEARAFVHYGVEVIS